MSSFKKLTLLTATLFLMYATVNAQITAPTSSASFTSNYTSGFLSAGGINDAVYVFCSNQNNNSVGELNVASSGCTVNWFVYDGFSYSDLGQTGGTATGLMSGLYMAQVDCGGTISCHRAWVWVNQTFVDVDPIDPGCESFTLNASAAILDDEFEINDPPGINFEIDENTFIKVCFWADHTFVSDLGFYLKAPGEQLTEPDNPGVVALLPSASDWGIGSTHESNLTIPWTVTGCDPAAMGTPCNNGNHVDEFCFSTHVFPGGPELTPGNPTEVPCVCDLPVPLQGIYAPAEAWDPIFGYLAGDPGWAVQIYDCEDIDFGTLNMSTLVFRAETECGQTTFVYDSGEISSTINDNSCDAANASLYVVPPGEPAGGYTVTSQITDYSWSCTGSGFNGDQLSHDIVHGTSDFPTVSSDFILTVTETINAPGSPQCEVIDTEQFLTLPADATITPVTNICTNSTPFQLESVDGGGIWTTNAPAGAIVNNIFYPGEAGEGTWTVDYAINGPCPDADQITITVYESIEIENFSDNICDGTNTNYTVSFDVVNEFGNPAPFNVDYGIGESSQTGDFSQDFPTQTSYSITVTDSHNCAEYILEGYRDCGCTTYAGTLSSSVPVHLCQGDCTDALTHNSDEILDGDDMIEFAIHDGNYPATIYAYNNTPEFCFSDISGGVAEQFYYISAIAGNNSGGHVMQSDPCYSQSVSTPVVWHANPIAHIVDDEISTCGLSTQITANEPVAGQMGTWTATHSFTPVSGTINSYDLIVLKDPPYENVVFTWTVVNNECIASDDITVNFVEAPSAYAGEDITICGSEATMAAVLSLPSSSGIWSGNGSFATQSDPSTAVTGQGIEVYTWREENGICWDEDYVTVTFVQEPQPTTSPNVDTVCGIVYNLDVYNVIGDGFWTAYSEGIQYVPAPFYEGGNNIPDPVVFVTYGDELHKEIDFVWEETIQQFGVECTNTATKTVVFARQPIASVGASDAAEICGSCFEFAADTTGSGWAFGTWIAKDIIGDWADSDPTIPNASYCIDSLGSYGDTAQVTVDFLWVMRNYGCTSIDTMHVSFFERPEANAGLDDAICGNIYTLGAVYDLTEVISYTPTGMWSLEDPPIVEATASFSPSDNDTVSVSATHFGIYPFIFRENNSNMPSCYSQDTVEIEFVENPIISAGEDKDVCGQITDLEGTTANFEGSWLPNGSSFVDYEDPTTQVSVSSYGDYTYTWLESNTATTSSLSCSAQDEVVITYWRIPTANILTDPADSTTCGLTFERLRAELPGSEIGAVWYTENPSADFLDEFDNDTEVTVPNYGYHDFYWIEYTGPGLGSDFCNDTAGPLTIHFIEIPDANAGGDTLYCGLSGSLNAIPSVGNGVWSTPSTENISFVDASDPYTEIESNIINTGNPSYPSFQLIWTEDNTNGCTDMDTMQVIFARIPDADMHIIPPKCFGELATIAAVEDSLQQYTWNFYNGVVDDTVPANDQGGYNTHFVFWNSEDTLHQVSLVSMNSYNCQSVINIDTVYEPPIPEFEYTLISDTCMLGKGGIIFTDTLQDNSFFWLDPIYGPASGTPFDTVYNLPSGIYNIMTSYLSFNTTHYAYYLTTFGTPNCVDTMEFEIEPIGMIEAEIEVSADVDLYSLVAPDANVTFMNNSDYDDVSKRCEWHFGDETIEKNCDPLVEHTYTESGCYEPFLIVMNRDLPECRDTALLDACIPVDNASKIEVPNIFSPNGDGYNDFFQVKAQTLKTFQGTILNRWGRSVHTWENWEDYEGGWNGKLNGGTKATSGVYYYIIKAEGMDGVPYDIQGPLHLISE